MNRIAFAAGLCALVALVGCKKEEKEPEPIPVSSAAPAAATAESSAEAATSASAAPATPPPVATTAAPVTVAEIDRCCAALDNYKGSGRGKDVKSKAATGARLCHGIAGLVRSGKTSRAEALAQIRAGLSGLTTPPECQ